ncbi:facilitated trehalose transporter Tret1 [Plutella xylostella]|uniref:facilitated trehalose transporter Tret1 n=1 Tax=Plutella xylostella TaxID=51655 RepID=UPI0020326D33|nr:facilitated trehalose transporter Tret1 [Plutella xylostella]
MLAPYIKQSWVALGVDLNAVNAGTVIAFPYCLLPALRAPGSPIPIDVEAGSWLATSVTISTSLGVLLSSWLMVVLGRRAAHVLLPAPSLAGWLLLARASSYSELMLGRALCGVSLGSVLILGSTVLGEYTSPRLRATFLASKSAAYFFGTILIHTASQYLDWRSVALVSLMPNALTVLNACTWPESPSWLVTRRRFKDAETSFFWLRGRSDESIKEFDEFIRSQKLRMQSEPPSATVTKSVLIFFKNFTRGDFLKPIALALIGMVLVEASGRHTFSAFAKDIIGQISGEFTVQSFYFTILIDIINIVCNCATCVLTKIFKRRTLLFFSGISCLVILSTISLYLLLVAREVISKDRSWIPLSLLGLYFCLTNIGCCPIPIVLFGELFPLGHRGSALAVATLVHNIPIMLYMKTTPVMLEYWRVHGTLLASAAVTAVTLLYMYFTLPETYNKTLQEVEDYFVKRPTLEKDNECDSTTTHMLPTVESARGSCVK